MHDQVEFQCFLLWAKWGTWISVKFRVPGQLVIVALFHKKEMEGYCKQQLIRVKFLCALTLVDFVFSILTLTALLVILHVSTELNKPLYLFWVRQDRCKLFYSLKWFCSCYLKASGAGVCPQSKDWMKGKVLIFSSSVCQRMLKDGFALKTRKWRGTFVWLSFEQRSEKGNDSKKKLLRLKDK